MSEDKACLRCDERLEGQLHDPLEKMWRQQGQQKGTHTSTATDTFSWLNCIQLTVLYVAYVAFCAFCAFPIHLGTHKH